MGGLARVQEARRRPGGTQGACDFLRDVPGFSHACRDDLVFAAKQQVYCGGKMLVERNIPDRLGFRIQYFLCALQCLFHDE
jgi:hypothetical protein